MIPTREELFQKMECNHEKLVFLFATMGILKEEDLKIFAPLKDRIMVFQCENCKKIIV